MLEGGLRRDALARLIDEHFLEEGVSRDGSEESRLDQVLPG